jgi:hypothetical protein
MRNPWAGGGIGANTRAAPPPALRVRHAGFMLGRAVPPANESLEQTGRPTALPRPELRPGRPAAQAQALGGYHEHDRDTPR